MKTRQWAVLALSFAILMVSCKKDDKPAPQPNPGTETSGVYVLNEGLFGQNNTMLTFYNFETEQPQTDFYQEANGSSLGDTGNDLLIYGSKMYIVMNVSSYLEVAEASTAKSIQKIDLKDGTGKPLEPRYVIPYKNFVFVSCWDGSVKQIDTTSLNIVKSVNTGRIHAEQMAIANNKLYVAVAGSYPDYDSTVSVIDLSTKEEVTKIKAGINPTVVATDGNDIFVGYAGNFGDIPGGLVKIDATSDEVVAETDTDVSKLRFYNGNLYGITGGFIAPAVSIINTEDLSLTVPDFITDGTAIAVPYALNIDEKSGDVYVSDAVDYQSPGTVYCFDSNGKKKFSFSVNPGVNPNTIAVLQGSNPANP